MRRTRLAPPVGGRPEGLRRTAHGPQALHSRRAGRQPGSRQPWPVRLLLLALAQGGGLHGQGGGLLTGTGCWRKGGGRVGHHLPALQGSARVLPACPCLCPCLGPTPSGPVPRQAALKDISEEREAAFSRLGAPYRMQQHCRVLGAPGQKRRGACTRTHTHTRRSPGFRHTLAARAPAYAQVQAAGCTASRTLLHLWCGLTRGCAVCVPACCLQARPGSKWTSWMTSCRRCVGVAPLLPPGVLPCTGS